MDLNQGCNSRDSWTAWKDSGFSDSSSNGSEDISSPKSRLAQPGSWSSQIIRSDRRGYVGRVEQCLKNHGDRPEHSSGDLLPHPRVPQPGSGTAQEARCGICGYGLASQQSLEHHRNNLHPSSQPRVWRSEVLNQTYQPQAQQSETALLAKPTIPM